MCPCLYSVSLLSSPWTWMQALWMEHGCRCPVFQGSAKVSVRGEGIAESERFCLPTSPSQTQPRRETEVERTDLSLAFSIGRLREAPRLFMLSFFLPHFPLGASWFHAEQATTPGSQISASLSPLGWVDRCQACPTFLLVSLTQG